MISGVLRRSIWNGLLESARLTHYYQQLADKHRKLKRIRDACMQAGVCVLAATSITLTFDWMIVPAALLLILSVYVDKVFTFQPEQLDSLADDFGLVQKQYRNLFEDADCNAVEVEAARRIHQMLAEDIEAFGRRVRVSIDNEILSLCEEESDRVERSRYAT